LGSPFPITGDGVLVRFAVCRPPARPSILPSTSAAPRSGFGK